MHRRVNVRGHALVFFELAALRGDDCGKASEGSKQCVVRSLRLSMKFVVVVSVAAAVAGVADHRADDFRSVPRPSFAEPLPSFPPRSNLEPISADQALIVTAQGEDAEGLADPTLKTEESSKPNPELPTIGVTALPAPLRPSWIWPPLLQWSWAPGSPIVSWTWEPAPHPELPQTTRIASMIVLTTGPVAKPPPWLQNVSSTIAAISPPLWPRVPIPDFRVATGHSHLAHVKNLEPPQQFVRWSDRLENVLPDAREVDRRCRASGAKSPPGETIRGCAHRVVDRCFIIRIDDPGVARHELAHCNGWKHPP